MYVIYPTIINVPYVIYNLYTLQSYGPEDCGRPSDKRLIENLYWNHRISVTGTNLGSPV